MNGIKLGCGGLYFNSKLQRLMGELVECQLNDNNCDDCGPFCSFCMQKPAKFAFDTTFQIESLKAKLVCGKCFQRICLGFKKQMRNERFKKETHTPRIKSQKQEDATLEQEKINVGERIGSEPDSETMQEI